MSKRRFALSSGMSLARLKAGFIVLGVILLGGLAALSLAVEERLNEAARDREEMVALRTFDELEREVSAFLDIENERASYVNLKSTDPAAWAPFVVGYFRVNDGASETVAANGNTSDNERRLQWALDNAQPQLQITKPAVPGARHEQERGQAKREKAGQVISKKRPASVAPKKPAPAVQQRTGSKIIEQLNRAPVRRKGAKKDYAPAQEANDEDQFQDYQELF